MAQMAHPYRHPKTGVYYLRRQIPEKLRPAFDGKALFQQSLKTKDYVRAAQLFVAANAELERQFEVARQRLASTGDPRPSQHDKSAELIRGYFEGDASAPGGLNGPERLILTFIEVDRGLQDNRKQRVRYGDRFVVARVGCTSPAPSDADHWWKLSTNAAAFNIDEGVERARHAFPPASTWREFDPGEYGTERLDQARRVVEQIARFHDLDKASLPPDIVSDVLLYLDTVRLDHETAARKREGRRPTLRPTMRLEELHADWVAARSPGSQAAAEVLTTVREFVEYFGDIPVSEIQRGDLIGYAAEIGKLPAKMPRTDRNLPFTARVDKYKGCEGPFVTATTVKKRVGGLQWLIAFAHQQEWISANVGEKLVIEAPTGSSPLAKRAFWENELTSLFSSPIFSAPERWRTSDTAVSSSTIYWILLLGLTSGARLEEIGQCMLSDLIEDGGLYLEITDYVAPEDGTAKKHVKNEGSKRIVPIHPLVLELGFRDYVSALRAAGHRTLFPELRRNVHGKRTQVASQKINRYIDSFATSDRRASLHSLRHNFKSFGDDARVSERMIDQICGHAPITPGRRYGWRSSARMLSSHLERIRFDCVDWELIRQAAQRVDWVKVAASLHHTSDEERRLA